MLSADNVHWRVEVKNCSADTTSADFEREDCSKEADAQAHARTTHRDDTAAGSVGASEHADAVEWDIVLRSRSKCCEDILSEHAVAKVGWFFSIDSPMRHLRDSRAARGCARRGLR